MFLQIREELRNLLIRLRSFFFRLLWKHNIHPTARISFAAFLDKTCIGNIIIGEYTIVTRGAVIMSHDFSLGKHMKTEIGSYCLIVSSKDNFDIFSKNEK